MDKKTRLLYGESLMTMVLTATTESSCQCWRWVCEARQLRKPNTKAKKAPATRKGAECRLAGQGDPCRVRFRGAAELTRVI